MSVGFTLLKCVSLYTASRARSQEGVPTGTKTTENTTVVRCGPSVPRGAFRFGAGASVTAEFKLGQALLRTLDISLCYDSANLLLLRM